jgi:hypothetical protein
MVLNPTQCRTLEIIPEDGHKIASQIECLMGGAIFDAQTRIAQQTPETPTDGANGVQFKYEGIQWSVRSVMCRQDGDDDNTIQEWLDDQKKHRDATKGQIQ